MNFGWVIRRGEVGERVEGCKVARVVGTVRPLAIGPPRPTVWLVNNVGFYEFLCYFYHSLNDSIVGGGRIGC